MRRRRGLRGHVACTRARRRAHAASIAISGARRADSQRRGVTRRGRRRRRVALEQALLLQLAQVVGDAAAAVAQHARQHVSDDGSIAERLGHPR